MTPKAPKFSGHLRVNVRIHKQISPSFPSQISIVLTTIKMERKLSLTVADEPARGQRTTQRRR
jgi:hypothetical protein